MRNHLTPMESMSSLSSAPSNPDAPGDVPPAKLNRRCAAFLCVSVVVFSAVVAWIVVAGK